MAPTWTQIEDAIHAWVAAASGLGVSKVIWAEQGGPRPATPYISLNIIADAARGVDWLNTVAVPLTFDDLTVSLVDFANNELDITGHALATGDGPIQLETTGTLPTGLAESTDYYAIAVSADALSVANSLVDANDGTAVAFSDVGSGTHTVVDTSETERAGAEINHTVRGPRTFDVSIQAFTEDPLGTNGARAIIDAVISKVRLPSIADPLVTAQVGVGSFEPITIASAALSPAVFEPRAVTTAHLHVAKEVSETGTYIESVEFERAT